jgi:diguanylate cyclase (GGDEF)-like protein
MAIASLCVFLTGLLFLALQTRAIFSDVLKQEYVGLVLEAIERAEVARSAVGQSKGSLDAGERSSEAYRGERANLAARLTTLAALVAASPFEASRIPQSALSPEANLNDADALLSLTSANWRDERDRISGDMRMRISRLADTLIVLSALSSTALITALVMYAKHARQLADESHEFKHDALHDEMTGLPNRRHLLETLEAAARPPRGHMPDKIAVLYIDLDGFKGVNDSLGHRAGDEFLIAVSGHFRQAVRSTDIVARIGGDEFAVLIREFSTDEQLAAIAERLIVCVRQTAERMKIGVVSASIGIASFPGFVKDYRHLVDVADATMYQAKRRGKSCYAFAVPKDG